MSDAKFKPPQINYREFRLYDVLSVETIADMLVTHKLAGNEYIDRSDYDLRKNRAKSKVMGILDNNINPEGNPLKEYWVEQEEVNEYGEVESCLIRCIKLSEFIAFADSRELAYPPEIRMNSAKSAIQADISVTETISVKQEVEFDDVISDETIVKMKDLPLPKLKQQVVMLATERNKWDASMRAATKIGILFYEGGLPKPATLEVFISEYKKHLGELPNLPDTAIKKIYKYLPDGYRHSKSGGRATKDKSQTIDINPIIKAAVYAGSLTGSKDAGSLQKLKERLAKDDIPIPADDILNKIFDELSDI